MFLAWRQPLVAVVIYLAAKEEVAKSQHIFIPKCLIRLIVSISWNNMNVAA